MNKINSALSLIGFPSLRKIIDIQLIIFFSKYSNRFMTGNIVCSSYRIILKKIEEANSKVECNKNSINANTYLATLE